ncbi:MAG: hypothetical protein RLZZ231_1499 [Bacteroidota bacterium]|jgi:hypothetical protein
MKKSIKIVLVVLLMGIIAFFGARYYAYHFGQRDLQSEETKFTVTSSEIVNEFVTNVAVANQKYLEKPIVVTGKVTTVSGNNVLLDQSINCTFEKADLSIKENQTLNVKGRVIGFDDLLGELKMDMCNLNQQ